MVDHTRRRRYQYDRVLIDSARILTAQFDDALVYLSGAQLEMLRNVSQYLRNLNTYVSEYQPGYYLTPDASDYDELLAIVADLEETLMGNPNTIWGYKDTRMLWPDHTKVGAGDYTLSGTTVPSGEVWRMDSMYAWNNDTACSKIELWADYSGFGIMILAQQTSPGIGELVRWAGLVTIREGGRLRARFYDCQDGDELEYKARGYIMAVPE